MGLTAFNRLRRIAETAAVREQEETKEVSSSAPKQKAADKPHEGEPRPGKETGERASTSGEEEQVKKPEAKPAKEQKKPKQDKPGTENGTDRDDLF